MWFNLFSRELKPFNEGYLPTKDGHTVYFRQFGNPQGIPVLSFHGGPGGSSRTKYAKLFNLRKYRIIQYDQRGCGQSQAKNYLYKNETEYLLHDAERLLTHLDIKKKIIVQGVSWGSTLALLFAEKYPQMVQKIIVSSVFLARSEDEAWVSHDSQRFYPDLWTQMKLKINNDNNVYNKYIKMLFSSDEKQYLTALSYLGSYEYMLGQLTPQFTEQTSCLPEELQSSRIYFHYQQNNFFMKENQILHQAEIIKNIPALIVHNRMDFCCPVKQAWDLHLALPQSVIKIAAGYGHSNPKLLKILKNAMNTFLM